MAAPAARERVCRLPDQLAESLCRPCHITYSLQSAESSNYQRMLLWQHHRKLCWPIHRPSAGDRDAVPSALGQGPAGLSRALAEQIRQRLGMQHGQLRYGPGQRDIEPLQTARLGVGDAGGLDDDHVIELQALGQADWDDRELA
jgi:hypothetical protein